MQILCFESVVLHIPLGRKWLLSEGLKERLVPKIPKLISTLKNSMHERDTMVMELYNIAKKNRLYSSEQRKLKG